MKIIELSVLSNGAHRNTESYAWLSPPEGWAMIPEDMEMPASYPFVGVEAEEIDGIMTVTALTPGTVPEPDLEPIKARRIAQSKADLATYLEAHPLQWTDGKIYSITAEKQQQLTGKLFAATMAQTLSRPYTLTWNDTGEVCQEWTLQDLSALAFAIDARVTDLVSYQQTQEVAMRNADTLDELDAIVVDYDSVEVTYDNI